MLQQNVISCWGVLFGMSASRNVSCPWAQSGDHLCLHHSVSVWSVFVPLWSLFCIFWLFSIMFGDFPSFPLIPVCEQCLCADVQLSKQSMNYSSFRFKTHFESFYLFRLHLWKHCVMSRGINLMEPHRMASVANNLLLLLCKRVFPI